MEPRRRPLERPLERGRTRPPLRTKGNQQAGGPTSSAPFLASFARNGALLICHPEKAESPAKRATPDEGPHTRRKHHQPQKGFPPRLRFCFRAPRIPPLKNRHRCS